LRFLASFLLLIFGLNLANDTYHFDSDDMHSASHIETAPQVDLNGGSLHLCEPNESGQQTAPKSHGCHFGHCNHILISSLISLHVIASSVYDYPFENLPIAAKSVNDFLRPPIA
jgi:hypothetical protein